MRRILGWPENNVRIEIPSDMIAAQYRAAVVGTTAISAEFLEDVLSSDSVMNMERGDEAKINAITMELEESGRDSGLIEPLEKNVNQDGEREREMIG